MTERFKIEIVLERQRLTEFGHFTNAICVAFPACVVTQTDALIAACAADQPDIPTILLALSKLATYARISAEPAAEFAQTLVREHGVATIPLSAFYQDGTDQRVIRFCFAKRDETILAAAERLRRVK